MCGRSYRQQEFAPSYKASGAEATEQCFEPDSATLGGKLGFVVLVGVGANKAKSFRGAGSLPHCGNKKCSVPRGTRLGRILIGFSRQ